VQIGANAARREEEYAKDAHVLRMFDLDERYGPFVGVSMIEQGFIS